MKIQIQKTVQTIIDTGFERKRIKKAFAKDKVTQKKLNKLMDLVEAQDWNKALKELQSKWWQGRDKECECPRYEFLGMLDPDRNGGVFNSWASYGDLILAFADNPSNLSIVEVK